MFKCAIIGVTLSLAYSFAQWTQQEQGRLLLVGLDGMRYWVWGAVALIVAAVIGLTLYPPRLQTLLRVTTIVVALTVLISTLVRIDGYNGNRTPRLAWRWTPTSEQQVAAYFQASQTAFDSKADHVAIKFKPTPIDFPGFLGANRDATIRSTELVSNWSVQAPKLLWKHPVGLGWASFAVVGQVAVTLEQREAMECVVCYDVKSGMELWCHSEPTRFENFHGDGPRTTPTIHQGKVYAMGATGLLTCVELATGKLIWKQSVLSEQQTDNLFFGTACSPLVVKDWIVVTPSGKCSAIAFSLDTGREAWRGGNDPASYASPILSKMADQEQILSFNGSGLRAYDLQGQPLWLFPWQTQGDSRVNVAQPVVVAKLPGSNASTNESHVLISSGYDMGSALLSIRHDNGQWTAEPVWTSKALKAKLSNFVVYGDHIYGLDNGLMVCVNLKSGERLWKGGRYGHGQMLLVQDKILIQSESGEVALVAASPEGLNELCKFEALSSKTWNHPALAGNILLVRNDHEAAAYELPTNSQPSGELVQVQ